MIPKLRLINNKGNKKELIINEERLMKHDKGVQANSLSGTFMLQSVLREDALKNKAFYLNPLYKWNIALDSNGYLVLIPTIK